MAKKLLETIYKAGKKKLQSMTKGSKKTTPKKTTPKVTPKKSTVKPATIDFKKAKRTLAGTVGVGAGVGYMAGRSKSSKSNNKPNPQRAPGSSGYKPTQTNKGPNMSAVNKPKKTVNAPKKEQTYYKSNPNKSNAPRPDYTPKKPETKEKEKFDRMAAARNQQRMAQKAMGFKKGGMLKKGGKVYCKDGCAVRGKTRGKLI